MSDFKFACPVCGQHLTADSSNSGGEIGCPTCFRRIIVPQAPASQDSKLILSAALAGEQRTSSAEVISQLRQRRRKVLVRWGTVTLVALFLVGLATGLWFYLEKLVGRRERALSLEAPAPVLEKKVHSFWTVDIGKVVLPETPVNGKIRGTVVETCSARVEGGTLTFRGGKDTRCNLKVVFFAQHPQELRGKAFDIPQGRPSPRPRVILSWREEPQGLKEQIFERDYVLKMSFGQPAGGKLPGEIYLSLPDEYKSFLAGRFVAEISDSGKK